MTIEHKIVVGLDDIKTVIIECKQCRTRVSMSPDGIQVSLKCPIESCGSAWIKGAPVGITSDYEASTSAHTNLLAAIGYIRNKKNGAAFRDLLEFDDDDSLKRLPV